MAQRRFTDVFGERPKVLWVASSGGHVAQAHRIERLLGVNPESMWVTFDVAQTRSLLEGRRVSYVDYVAPRDVKSALSAARRVAAIAKTETYDFIVSTGAAIAFFALPLRALVGKTPVAYIESLARSQGPSLTGKIMRFSPRVRTMTQYASWEGSGWAYSGTILDSFEARKSDESSVRKVFVTLGTIRPYRFDRLVDAVLEILDPNDQVVWQLGVTKRSDLPGEVYTEVSGNEMKRLMRDSDVVISHSGVGSILASMELGKSPVIAVRRGERGEHVDDHQQFIADVVVQRGLASELDISAPRRAVLEAAAATTVTSAT